MTGTYADASIRSSQILSTQLSGEKYPQHECGGPDECRDRQHVDPEIHPTLIVDETPEMVAPAALIIRVPRAGVHVPGGPFVDQCQRYLEGHAQQESNDDLLRMRGCAHLGCQFFVAHEQDWATDAVRHEPGSQCPGVVGVIVEMRLFLLAVVFHASGSHGVGSRALAMFTPVSICRPAS